MTDGNGSFTLDAGFEFSRVDVRVHCRNSAMRVVDDSDSIPGTARIAVKLNLGNGEVGQAGSLGNHFRILTQCQDVYDTVWRQFRPFDTELGGHLGDIDQPGAPVRLRVVA